VYSGPITRRILGTNQNHCYFDCCPSLPISVSRFEKRFFSSLLLKNPPEKKTFSKFKKLLLATVFGVLYNRIKCRLYKYKFLNGFSTVITLFINGYELFDPLFRHIGNSVSNPLWGVRTFLVKNKGDIKQSSFRFIVHNPCILESLTIFIYLKKFPPCLLYSDLTDGGQNYKKLQLL